MSSKSETTDAAQMLRDVYSTHPICIQAAAEIDRLRGLLLEIMSAPEAAYHGDWFARATEALP